MNLLLLKSIVTLIFYYQNFIYSGKRVYPSQYIMAAVSKPKPMQRSK